MRSCESRQVRAVTAATSASATAMSAALESHAEGAWMRAGSTCSAIRAIGDSHWSVKSTIAALPLRRGLGEGHQILLIAADVEDDEHVLAPEIDEKVAPVVGLAGDMVDAWAQDAEMRCHVAGDRVR